VIVFSEPLHGGGKDLCVHSATARVLIPEKGCWLDLARKEGISLARMSKNGCVCAAAGLIKKANEIAVITKDNNILLDNLIILFYS